MRFGFAMFAIALAATPAVAQSGKTMGYADIGVGWQNVTEAETRHLQRFTVDGAVNIPLAERFNLEFEGYGASQYGDRYAFIGHSESAALVHTYVRNQAGALGIFGGYTHIELGRDRAGDMLLAGAEAQGYLGNLTIYGQVAALTSRGQESDYPLSFNGWLARGTARFFITPDTRLQVDAQWVGLTSKIDAPPTNIFSLVGTAEHRFAGTPFSAFVSGRWDRVTSNYAVAPFSAGQITIGGRFYFGGSALENDRSGATMDVVPWPVAWFVHVG